MLTSANEACRWDGLHFLIHALVSMALKIHKLPKGKGDVTEVTSGEIPLLVGHPVI